MLEHYDVPHSPTRTTQVVHCPLHEDRTPSCSIDTDQGLFNCHACGVGGDAYTLIMEKEGIDFARAKDFAISHGFSAGDAGSSEPETGSAYGGRRRAAGKSGEGARKGYTPTWRRRA